MEQSFYRHFSSCYKELLELIKEKKLRIHIQKKLLKETATNEMSVHVNESILKLEKEIQVIQQTDLYLNFDMEDINYLRDQFELIEKEYEVVDKQIESIINLIHSRIIKIHTSEENKQIDKHNHTSNSLAKRKFIAAYPLNPYEYSKALKSRSSIKLLERNDRNVNIFDALNSKFNDKELLIAYKICETLAVQIPTRADIGKVTKFLVQQKLDKFLNKDQLKNIQQLIENEVILQIINAPLIDQDQLQVLTNQLELLEDKYYKEELKKLQKRDLTAEEIWDSII